MGKVKIKKSDIWIDMTPMSDVMTLLLTFFMLTSTFVKNEPVKVNTPGSVSEIKVPENGVLTILVSPEKDKAGNPTGEGQVFMSIDNTDQLGATLSTMTGAFGVSLNPKQIETFKSEGLFGVPMGDLSTYLTMNASKRPQYLQTKGIPLDSIKGGMSEFQQWVDAARNVNEDIKIAQKQGCQAFGTSEPTTFVEVNVVDKDGNLCPNADNQIFFSVSGEQDASGHGYLKTPKILGTDNGCQTSLERFTDLHRKAFFGKCVVVIKGKGILKAQAVDLKDASVAL